MQKTLRAVASSPNDTQPAKSPVRRRWTRVAAIAAAVFGVATVVSGASTLFGPQEVRAAAGAVVQFVLWFNFLAGFAYVLAGIGLWRGAGWAPMLAIAIATATVAVFAAFLWHVGAGGAWEARTMGAMILRSAIWIAIAAFALRCHKPSD